MKEIIALLQQAKYSIHQGYTATPCGLIDEAIENIKIKDAEKNKEHCVFTVNVDYDDIKAHINETIKLALEEAKRNECTFWSDDDPT